MPVFFRLVILVLLGAIVSSCHVGRFFIYNFADIRDHKKFPYREIGKDSISFQFYETAEERAPRHVTVNEEQIAFDDYLEDNKTVAFLIIQRDTILYENYFRRYDRESVVPSFSMAKSVISLLLGCAIDDGYIQSENVPVTIYLPELKERGFDKVTIRHLLQMTSGLDYSENYYSPFSKAAKDYYGRQLRKDLQKVKLEKEPGENFKYTSGTTQLLALVLERSLPEDQTISGYLEQRIWKPLGMEYPATWSVDRKGEKGMEKAFCCLNARARDFAKIGRLYLNEGKWNGRQIVSSDWVEKSTALDTAEGSASFYQYQWWMPTPGKDFMANGHLGQYVYVYPEKELIIVRLGKNYGDAGWWKFFPKLAAAY